MRLVSSFPHERGLRRLGLNVLVWSWCLPSTLLGVLAAAVVQILGGEASEFRGAVVIRWVPFRALGGVCLGQVIVVSDSLPEEVVLHEWGHFRQCLRLGPLYYPVVGLPSVVHAAWFRRQKRPFYEYFHFYTEAWADHLGGVYGLHGHRFEKWTGYLRFWEE